MFLVGEMRWIFWRELVKRSIIKGDFSENLPVGLNFCRIYKS